MLKFLAALWLARASAKNVIALAIYVSVDVGKLQKYYICGNIRYNVYYQEKAITHGNAIVKRKLNKNTKSGLTKANIQARTNLDCKVTA